MNNYSKILVVLIAIGAVSLFPKKASAQYDYMFTQYMWNEIVINPAYTGTRDVISVVGMYRNQWVGMEGAPVTRNISANAPIYKQRIGLGVNYIKDEIGINSTDYFSLSYSYRIPFQNSNLSFGLSTAFATLKEYYSRVTTTDPNDTQFQSDSPRANMPNFGFGVYYYTDKYYVGLSIPRLMKNQIELKDGFKVSNHFDYSYFHYFFTAGAIFPISEELKFQPSAMFKAVKAAPMELDLTAQMVIRDMFRVGLGWRSGDAISFLTTIHVTPQLRIGYSYDYTTSDLAKYSRGTHEICFGYDFSLRAKKIISPRIF